MLRTRGELSVSARLKRGIRALDRRHPEPRPLQTQRVAPWFAVDGDHTLRVTYPLTAESLVVDLGGYEGQWASDIFAMYRCKVLVFEPVPEYAGAIARRFAANPDIVVHPFGLAHETHETELSVDRASSSTFKTGGPSVRIQLVDAVEFLEHHAAGHVDLLKVNIEGGEYDLLDRLIAGGWIDRITDLQIHFHDFVPNAQQRMKSIQDALRRTHYPTYQYEFVWENWRHRSTLGSLAERTPRVSVVLPVHNGEQFLAAAIDSVLEQSLADLELVIVNDGSTDRSEEIIRLYEDPRISYYAHENMGLGASLNRGISLARADLVARMDCDDVAHPGRLQAQTDYLSLHPDVAAVGTSFDVVDPSLRRLETFTALTEPDDVALDMFVRNPVGHGTAMFRKAIIQDLGGYDETSGAIEDYDLWWRVSRAHQVGNVPQSLYQWRVVTTSVSNAGSDVRQPAIRALMNSIWQDPPELPTARHMAQRLRQYQAAEPTEVAGRLSEQYAMSMFALSLALMIRGYRRRGARLMISVLCVFPRRSRDFLRLYNSDRSARGFNLSLLRPMPG